MFRFAPEGYPFIAAFSLITVLTYIFWGYWGAVLPFSLTVFMAFFFRDPERNIPEGEEIFVSPADGKVIKIDDVYEGDYLKSDVKQISIFMSPLNVHVNRSPCDGTVTNVKYSPGKYMAAYKDDASLKNENIVMVLDGKEGNVLVRQVAGFVARRAVCRAKVGDNLKRGQRYGLIKFSSRLDVYIPHKSEISVRIGEKVRAGETIIAVKNRH